MKTKKFIANGRFFGSLEAVEKYASDNGWVVTGYEHFKGVTLCTLSSK